MATEQEKIEEQRKKEAAEAAEIAKAKKIAAEEEQTKLANLGINQAKAVSFKLEQNDKTPDWDQSFDEIYQAYRDLDPENKNTKNGGVMYFPTIEAAKKFFQGFADKGMSFLSTELGKDGHLKDAHFYSCGTKKMFEGSFQEIYNQLLTEQKTAKGEDLAKIQEGIQKIGHYLNKSPSLDFKNKFKEVTKDPEEADASEELERGSSIPDPLRRKPPGAV